MLITLCAVVLVTVGIAAPEHCEVSPPPGGCGRWACDSGDRSPRTLREPRWRHLPTEGDRHVTVGIAAPEPCETTVVDLLDAAVKVTVGIAAPEPCEIRQLSDDVRISVMVTVGIAAPEPCEILPAGCPETSGHPW